MPADRATEERIAHRFPRFALLAGGVVSIAAALSWLLGFGDNLHRLAELTGLISHPVSVENRMQVSAQFKPGSSTDYPPILMLQFASLSHEIQNNQDYKVVLVGFSDFIANQPEGVAVDLARARENTIRSALISFGVPAERIYENPPVVVANAFAGNDGEVLITVGPQR